jgi:hypothetical protein
LRGIWQTAPYLHDGSAPTLLDVVDSRNPDDRHGFTRALSDIEHRELVSYLLQLDNVALEDEKQPARVVVRSTGCTLHRGKYRRFPDSRLLLRELVRAALDCREASYSEL